MILTAYAALCFWLFVSTSRTSDAARSCLDKSRSARTTTLAYQKILDDDVKEVGRTKNAEELRADRIPAGLLASQKEFPRSLGGTATEEYKKQRHGLIADAEDRQAEIAVGDVEIFGQIVEHYRKLAEKYKAAARQPWLPIEPDPPMPSNNPLPAGAALPWGSG